MDRVCPVRETLRDIAGRGNDMINGRRHGEMTKGNLHFGDF